ncbi:hypothetical protein TQ32_02020 [Pyrococcus kukulkanii]|uniref:DUF4258 domain-containing protein n=2 Tax=Pyrococcus kukulkanii TaxID=1609559 RepID=A0A127B7P3_9EURY|nr:hypothetical protein TQ32_02020 [Pyrococcus kukulkanii]
MDFMRFINLLRSSSIAEIVFTDHVKQRLEKRNISDKLVESLLRRRQKDLRGVEQQGKNRFKLTYVHPEKEDTDLVIVVEVRERKSKMKLVIVTVFPQPSSRRIRVVDNE